MFTGIDLIVIAFAGFAILYLADNNPKEVKFSIDPLAFLVVGIVALFVVAIL